MAPQPEVVVDLDVDARAEALTKDLRAQRDRLGSCSQREKQDELVGEEVDREHLDQKVQNDDTT